MQWPGEDECAVVMYIEIRGNRLVKERMGSVQV